MSNRFSRIIAGVFLAAAVASVLWSRATGVLSTSAIINAPIVSIRAPFDGSVEEASKRCAEAVSKGDPLITLAATERSEFDLTTLKSERDALEGRIESLGNRIRKTRALKASLVERFAEEIEVEIAHLGSRIEAASARLTASRARRDRVAADLDRAVALEERSAVAESRVEDLRLQIAARNAEVSENSAELAVILIERQALAVPGIEQPQVRPESYTLQRIDELDIRLIEMTSQREALIAESDALIPRIATLKREAAREDRFRPVAPSDSVIWASSRARNAAVVAGETLLDLLDCSRRFVEAAVNERHASRIGPGSVAEVKLKGASQSFSTPVTSLRGGSFARTGEDRVAVHVPRSDAGLTLFLELPPADIERQDVAASFCSVGRTADVRIIAESVPWLPDTLPWPLSYLDNNGEVALRPAPAKP